MKSDDKVRKFVSGRCIPVRGNDIDTDRIIPARYMKVISFNGLGEFAFYDERFDSEGGIKPHSFNSELYKQAEILLVNKNFGCGSSREHAPQALYRSGIRAVVGESFAEIFEGNCTAMGIPAVTVSAEEIDTFMRDVELSPELEMKIDIQHSKITFRDRNYTLRIPASARSSLTGGVWDSTSTLLSSKEAIIRKSKDLPYMNSFSG